MLQNPIKHTSKFKCAFTTTTDFRGFKVWTIINVSELLLPTTPYWKHTNTAVWWHTKPCALLVYTHHEIFTLRTCCWCWMLFLCKQVVVGFKVKTLNTTCLQRNDCFSIDLCKTVVGVCSCVFVNYKFNFSNVRNCWKSISNLFHSSNLMFLMRATALQTAIFSCIFSVLKCNFSSIYHALLKYSTKLFNCCCCCCCLRKLNRILKFCESLAARFELRFLELKCLVKIENNFLLTHNIQLRK